VDKRFLGLLACGLVLGASGCSGRRLLPTDPTAGSSVEASAARQAADLSARHDRRGAAGIVGDAADGSIFALYRPDHWNGDLVVYAHGFIVPFLPIALPTNDFVEAIRDSLLSDGYAVAYSSFATNGFAVKDGIEDTGALSDRFRARLGSPHHTYLMAHSLGGLVAVALAERFPERYDGAVMFSGLLGGSRRELAYVSNVRVLFDYFYPGVLPGDLLHLPGTIDLNRDVIGPAVAAIQAHPEGAAAMSQVEQTPLPFADPNELVQSIVQALSLQVIELRDLLQRTGGQSFFDNEHTVYRGPLPAPLLRDLNAHVARYEMSGATEEFLRRDYEPSGRLEFPLLALHTTRDPTVPIFNETVYERRVRAAGRSGYLTQRTEDRYGHVGFPPHEIMAAFFDLVQMTRQVHRHEEGAVAERR
jgi:pimeloyl-ACP methyl ester carboxylesterase